MAVVQTSGQGTDRTQITTTAQGLLSQNYDRSAATATSIMIGGTAYAMLVGLRGGDTISNGYVQLSVAATSASMFKMGIYSLDGTVRYALSADQSALMSSNGPKTIPFITPWTAPADGGYMVVIVGTTGSVMPTLYRNLTSGVSTQIGSKAIPYCTAGAALSDLPAVTVTYAFTSTPISYWVGLS